MMINKKLPSRGEPAEDCSYHKAPTQANRAIGYYAGRNYLSYTKGAKLALTSVDIKCETG